MSIGPSLFRLTVKLRGTEGSASAVSRGVLTKVDEESAIVRK